MPNQAALLVSNLVGTVVVSIREPLNRCATFGSCAIVRHKCLLLEDTQVQLALEKASIRCLASYSRHYL